jgi:hypothetical protein
VILFPQRAVPDLGGRATQPHAPRQADDTPVRRTNEILVGQETPRAGYQIECSNLFHGRLGSLSECWDIRNDQVSEEQRQARQPIGTAKVIAS